MGFYNDVVSLEDKQNMHEFAKMGLMPELGQTFFTLTNDVEICAFEKASNTIKEVLFLGSAILAAIIITIPVGLYLCTL